MIRQWRDIERWIETAAAPARTSGFPLVPLHKLLTERKEPVRVTGELGEWQPITIKFSGDVLARDRTGAFKGAMFAAYPGDVVFSKIDARNGAVGLIPVSMPKVVLTPEYPVMVPDTGKLLPMSVPLGPS